MLWIFTLSNLGDTLFKFKVDAQVWTCMSTLNSGVTEQDFCGHSPIYFEHEKETCILLNAVADILCPHAIWMPFLQKSTWIV